LIPTVIGGNFNILRFGNEKNKPGGTDRFSDMFINAHALREIRLSGGSLLGLIIRQIQLWRNLVEFLLILNGNYYFL
jgi:hypothetical protein